MMEEGTPPPALVLNRHAEFRTGNHFGETSPPTSVQLGEHVIQNQHGLPITVRAGI